MQLNRSVIYEIMEINWLSNSGKADSKIAGIDCFIVSDKNKAIKNLLANRWENICLEATNQLTAYLAKNEPDAYNGFWNAGVKEIKRSILPIIADKIQTRCYELDIPIDVFDYMKMDIVSIIMVLSYREYFYSEFYENLFTIYKSGFLPCGWLGKFPGGKYEVY